MSGLLRPAPANLLLGLFGLALAGSLALDLVARPTTPGGEARLATAPASADAPAAGDGMAAFRSVLERPLFAPSRRATSQAAPVAATTAAAPPNLELVGIVAAGEDAFALVRQPGGRVQRLAIGQAIGDWRLDALEQDRAAFTRDGMRAIVPLMRRRQTQPMPATEPWLTPPPPATGR